MTPIRIQTTVEIQMDADTDIDIDNKDSNFTVPFMVLGNCHNLEMQIHLEVPAREFEKFLSFKIKHMLGSDRSQKTN